MNKKIIFILATILAGLTFTGLASAVPQVGAGLTPDVATTQFDQLIKNTINWILGLLGFIAVVVIIFAGIKTVVSSSNPDEAKKSLETLKWAIIGLIVVIASYAIVNFILGFFITQ